MVAKMSKEEIVDDHSSDLLKEPKQGKGEDSDAKTMKDPVSSHGNSLAAEDGMVERAARVSKINASKDSSESGHRGSRLRSDTESNKARSKTLNNTPKKSTKSNTGLSKVTNKHSPGKKPKDGKSPSKSSSDSSEGVDEAKDIGALDEISNGDQSAVKDIDMLDEISNGAQSVLSDDEIVNAEENDQQEDESSLNQKIEEMEARIEKLEEELREVAALEISLYSVVPEHGSSAHKVHTPARRLSRLYIHACKHWTQDKRATVAKNTVSGLIFIAKSCGNDVPRLTFWLSNTIVLREIISQAFGSSHNSSPLTRFPESRGASGKSTEGKSIALKWKGSPASKQGNGSLQFVDDWQETGTLTAALVHVESWIFARIVESIWWQAVTPYMQSPAENLCGNRTTGKLLGPALGDLQQGSFSVNLWKNAFKDAFQRLCPVRADGHDCGCLPVLARKVMEQCVARLDVAMFNAILRESAHEIPTDPVSDPIVDSRVLPIPAGELSFGSGAQLKNSVGSWSRWLTEVFGMDSDDPLKEDGHNNEDDDRGGRDEHKSFYLLDELSDLLMLPKDMLMDRSVRKEVCPCISLSLIKRILCNFTPDEFCPEPVPGAVLESLNAEGVVERRFSGESSRSFPYAAASVVYHPPSSDDVAEKVADAGGSSRLSRNASIVKKKGYTSDEELDEIECPLASIIDKLPPSPTMLANGSGISKDKEHADYACKNSRFELLKEVWLRDVVG
ncbi:hypothetical protein HS088_TW23G00230 [Tripterygium wilfordii]|uniref:Nucleolar protein gar2-related n=1 Tax=Tripterygium wilfordii TaxID=458696 RepID=A0A7J7BV59_TRIWF|nr:uncharacterized protein LOC119992900 [Tripterygium wilfordii]KAF5725507.1 hypothetical protein HS088_TW23G00230 [Tripterygium wilfordii]